MTLFSFLQSCMNHSCCPNTKAFKRDEVSACIFVWVDQFICHVILPSARQIWAVGIPLQDKDGHAVIIALTPISKDEEVSYSFLKSFRLGNQGENFGYVCCTYSFLEVAFCCWCNSWKLLLLLGGCWLRYSRPIGVQIYVQVCSLGCFWDVYWCFDVYCLVQLLMWWLLDFVREH